VVFRHLIVQKLKDEIELMKDKLDRYFAGDLPEHEKDAFLSEVNNDPSLKKEFIIRQNLLAVTDLYPQEEDLISAKEALEKFISKMDKKNL